MPRFRSVGGEQIAPDAMGAGLLRRSQAYGESNCLLLQHCITITVACSSQQTRHISTVSGGHDIDDDAGRPLTPRNTSARNPHESFDFDRWESDVMLFFPG